MTLDNMISIDRELPLLKKMEKNLNPTSEAEDIRTKSGNIT
jgi:hypothetical protein